MAKAIWFDMDGTLANFYGVENWLETIRNYDATPYAIAKPLLNMSLLARYLNRLQRNGYTIGVISWMSRESNPKFDEATEKAKREWLGKHLASVHFDFIDITPYGVPKHEGREGILFDDNAKIREDWGEGAEDVDNIIEILKGLL